MPEKRFDQINQNDIFKPYEGAWMTAQSDAKPNEGEHSMEGGYVVLVDGRWLYGLPDEMVEIRTA